MQTYKLRKSIKKDKKFDIITPSGKVISFGAIGYDDFTTHKDVRRKQRYLARHRRENWNKSGINTAGFWSRYLLWYKPGLDESIAATEKRFGIKIE